MRPDPAQHAGCIQPSPFTDVQLKISAPRRSALLAAHLAFREQVEPVTPQDTICCCSNHRLVHPRAPVHGQGLAAPEELPAGMGASLCKSQDRFHPARPAGLVAPERLPADNAAA